MKNISISKLFLFINGIIIILIISIATIASRIHFTELDLKAKQDYRYDSYQLALTLKESSEELTKMARAYVATGNSEFEDKYWEILAIRNGKFPRKNGKSIPLKALFKAADFTEKELAKLNEAEKMSNDMVKIETAAMNAAKGLFDDGSGNFLKKERPDKEYALNLLYNEKFFDEKEKIYQSINEFYQLLDKRTKSEVKQLKDKTQVLAMFMFSMFLITIILIIISYIIIHRKVVKPIINLQRKSKIISTGDLDIELKEQGENEIGKLISAIKKLLEAIKVKSKFIEEIGKGNLDTTFEPVSSKDQMGKSLLEMRKNLKESRTMQEKRNKEDAQRNWISEGLAKFNDILRKDNNDIQKLAYNIITGLVKYINANQGGLFVINDKDKNDIFVEQLSCFAYDRQRKARKKIPLTEGLIGRVIDEKKSIYLTEIPEDYIEIGSGLGDARPRSLLLVPLIANEQVLGAIEIASFKEFKSHQIQFVERIGESIASTISSVKINARTAELLELAQKNTEAMAAQEEEMRQNMEELQSAQEALDAKDKDQQKKIEELNKENQEKLNQMKKVQEEMAGKEAEMSSVLQAINNSTLVAELDLEGKLIQINDKFLEIFHQDNKKLIGEYYLDLAGVEQEFKDDFAFILSDVRSGKSLRKIHSLTIGEQEIWLSENYSPIKDKDGNVLKILCISENITHIKQQEKEVKKLLDDSRNKTHELETKEEELRQNMEEMKSTQEALAQKDEEQKKKIKALEVAYEKKIKELNLLKKEEDKRRQHQKNMQKEIIKKFKLSSKNAVNELKKQIEAKDKQINELKNKLKN